jgi:hypothetical protein
MATAVTNSIAKTTPGDILVILAKKHFHDLSYAEEGMFWEAANGGALYVADHSDKENSLTNSSNWKKDRVIRADRIEWLCTDPDASAQVTRKGVELDGVRVDGDLDLTLTSVRFPFFAEDCVFTGDIQMEGCKLCAFGLSHVYIRNLDASEAQIENGVKLENGFKAVGCVNFSSTTIGGGFSCAGGQFINSNSIALNMNRANIKGDVFLCDGFRADGQVVFTDTTIDGNFDCGSGIGGHLKSYSTNIYGVYALEASDIKIGGYAALNNGFEADGGADLSGATIGGALNCTVGQFMHSNSIALYLIRADIKGNVFLCDGFRADGQVVFTDATIDGNFDCGSGIGGHLKFYSTQTNAVGAVFALEASGVKIGGYAALNNRLEVDGGVDLSDATIGEWLNCNGGWLINSNSIALYLIRANLKGNVLLSDGFRADGQVVFSGATIDGNFDCGSGIVEAFRPYNTQKNATDPIFALEAYEVKIGGYAALHNGFKVDGGVDLTGATIGHDLICSGGQFISLNSIALKLQQANIKGNVLLSDGFRADGQVDLPDATIDGNFDCGSGIVEAFRPYNTQKNATDPIFALEAYEVKIGGYVALNNKFEADGGVDLSGAAIGQNLNCNEGLFINSNSIALNINRANIKGNVLLSNGFRANGQVDLPDATIDGNFDCGGGIVRDLSAYSTQTNGFYSDFAIEASDVKIGGYVALNNGFEVDGGVDFSGATIGHSFDCGDGIFINSNFTALSVSGAKINESAYLCDGFEAEGKVDLTGVIVNGNLDCASGRSSRIRFYGIQTNAENQFFALDAHSSKIGGYVALNNGFEADGGVDLSGATIGQNLDCNGGIFINSNSTALDVSRADINGSLLLNPLQAEGDVYCDDADVVGHLDLSIKLFSPAISTEKTSNTNHILSLRSMKVRTLEDDEYGWPEAGNLLMDNFVYEYISDYSPVNAKSRISWLHLQAQPNGIFFSQPYEQLAKVFHNMGRDRDAALIMVEKNRDYAKQLHWLSFYDFPRLIWYEFIGVCDGYGYLPGRALWISVGFVTFGTFIFYWGRHKNVIVPKNEKSHYAELLRNQKNDRKFNMSIYSLEIALAFSIETFIPFLKLETSQHWKPSNRLCRRYFLFHRIAGWVLTTLWFSALTGLLKT